MSKFLKGQDLVNLGNAVRRVTGYREGMTVAQMTDLLNEADSTFAAWDKSTGISITKSQVSDFSHTHIKADITDFAHNHDDRYYTEEETNTLLDAKLNISLKGAVNGLAELGSDGKVPSSQLPSYVDDVLEYANLTAFPVNGESGKIYIALDTNKTYRWSGSGYTEISSSLALGETSSTAGRGDWTKTAYDHTFLTNNPHSVTKAQVGLSNVDNTSDADKPISDATETALDNKVDKIEGKGLSANDFTNTDKNKLDGIEAGAEANTVLSVAGKTGSVLLDKEDVGLENVDNTADLAKPISTATQTALNLKADKTELTQLQADIATKVDKVSGKGLSTNDYTTTEKNKLAGIASGAEVNVQSNWNATSGDALILNKPYIPSKVSDLTNDTGYITGYTETDPIFTAWNKSTGISITKSQVSDLIEATQALSGLMSATDKQRLDVLHSLLEEDTENSVVDSINEVLAIFNNYPEGADLVTALAGKVDKVTGKGLSTNDLTNTLKSNYDTAYSWGNHTVEGYLKAITKAMVEAVLTGTITSHNHNGVYEPAFSKNTAFNKNFGTSSNTVAQGNHLHTGVYEPANSNIQSHISSISNPHNVSKSQVGLGNVDNTSDLDKPISTAQQTALDNKVDKVAGKALSTNDYTNNDKQSVEKIPTIEQDILDLESDKVDKNDAITAGTKAKITYDSKGLVTSGADLTEADIPTLPASKITQTTTARFVTDTEKSTWNGKQNALTAGDGISISGNVISATGDGLNVGVWDTATKTLALSDSNKLFKCSHTANQILTIPANATVAFPIGTMITFLLTSTYTVTFSGASGVTLTSMDSLVGLATQFAMASLIKTDTNTWQLVGALE